MIVDVYNYFTKHPKFNKRVGNNFVLVEYKCPLEVENFQLWTESHLITYVVSGKKDWLSSQRTYTIRQGDALFVKKGVYTTKQYLEDEYCVMLFFMNDDFIRDFVTQHQAITRLDSSRELSDSVIEIDTDDSFQTLVKSIFHYLTDMEDVPQELVELKFKELIFNVALNRKNHEFTKLILEIARTSKGSLQHVMDKNFQYDLPLSSFAKLSGRSLSSFKRDFKVHFGTTPAKWLLTKRLEHSTTLLRSTELNINEVCYESGFKSSSHFIRAFKSRFGLTPNQYKTENVLS